MAGILRIRTLLACVALLTSPSTIAKDTGVPNPIPQRYTSETILGDIGTMFYPLDKPKKDEEPRIFSIPPTSLESTSSRCEIDTNSSLSWLSLDFQSIWAENEETINHSVLIQWRVYNGNDILECSEQWRYLLLTDTITRGPFLTRSIELSGQACCRGTMIFPMHVYSSSLSHPWKLTSFRPELAVLRWQRINPVLTHLLTNHSGMNKMPVISQVLEWSQLLAAINAVIWTRFMLIRDMSTHQSTLSYFANSSSACCSIIANVWNSHVRCTNLNNELSIRNASVAKLRSCKGLGTSKRPRELAHLPGILIAVLSVPIVLGFLGKGHRDGDERQRCIRNTETIVCCFFSWICDLLKQISIAIDFPKQELSLSQYGRAGKSRSQRKNTGFGGLLEWVVITSLFCQSYTFAWTCVDIRIDLDKFPCLEYDDDHSLFNMKCSFSWNEPTECIILRANETFEGNGHTVNLVSISDWHGLFQIADSSNEGGPSSLEDAPVIHDVHIIGGETSAEGGFIIQSQQKHFIVNHCSSSGVLQSGGGGICGLGCSGDILITHCWSSGEIVGVRAGGIAGSSLGSNNNEDNTVTISHCYSTGNIVATHTGGICGYAAGYNSNGGSIIIKQCYSLGEILGSGSGGITGGRLAVFNGHGLVSITNCYSRGSITGSPHAGGICGDNTGFGGGIVLLTNVYASGRIMHADAGGLIGSIYSDAKLVSITMSVYDDTNGDMIGRNDAGNGVLTEKKNSGDLQDIVGTVYCYNDDHGEEDCWNTETIWQAVNDSFPVFRTSLPTATQCPSPTPSTTAGITTTSSPNPNRCTDIRNMLSEYPCLDYDASQAVFKMTCSFSWPNNDGNCIVLRKNERFEGNGHNIDLTDTTNWAGFIRIADDSSHAPSSLKDAPVVDDVHMIGGEIGSFGGGFIVQSRQNHFIVKHCSSSGVIKSPYSGGICGFGCSGDIFITHCWSSGEIRGDNAGGIAGGVVGLHNYYNEDNTVTISHCYSTGDILGTWSGGICGYRAGYRSNIMIKQCYSLGEIGGSGSGGITGRRTAWLYGHVSISNCYSRGNITGSENAGGICGSDVGVLDGTVILTNVYASGQIVHDDAGGLIGSIYVHAKQVNITMSVYNGRKGGMIGTNDTSEKGVLTKKHNSRDLKDIVGTVYCYNNGDCWDTDTVWQVVAYNFPILKSLLPVIPLPSVSDTPTPKETQMSTPTSSISADTITPSHSLSPASSATSTISKSDSLTSSPTYSATRTLTSSISPTTSLSGRKTSTPSSIQTSSHSPSTRVSVSSSWASTGSPRSLGTATISSSIIVTRTETISPSHSLTPSLTSSETKTLARSVSPTKTSSLEAKTSNSSRRTSSHTSSKSATASRLWASPESHASFNTATISSASFSSQGMSQTTQQSSATYAKTSLVSPTWKDSATPSTSATANDLLSVFPSKVSNASPLPTLSGSVSPSGCCQLGGESGLTATIERTDVLFGLCVFGILSLLILYIGYKRLRNKSAQTAKSQCDDADLYAIQLGVSKIQLRRKDKDAQDDNKSMLPSNGSQPEIAESVADNPLIRIQNIRRGGDNNAHENFGQNMIPSKNDMENMGGLPFILVNTTDMEPAKLSQIKVLSARRPDLGNIGKSNTSFNMEPKMKLAKISDLDTSHMSSIDRTVIRLRKWKARLLAEPTPVVAVSLPEDSDLGTLDQKPRNGEGRDVSNRLVSQLLFAANRQDSDRSAITTEISRYTQSRRRGVRRKKEFTAIPPSFLKPPHEGNA